MGDSPAAKNSASRPTTEQRTHRPGGNIVVSEALIPGGEKTAKTQKIAKNDSHSWFLAM